MSNRVEIVLTLLVALLTARTNSQYYRESYISSNFQGSPFARSNSYNAREAYVPSNFQGSTTARINSQDTRKTSGFEDDIRATCWKKTGSHESFNEIQSILESVPGCVEEKMDVERFPNDTKSLSMATRKKFFAKYCPQLQDSIVCFTPVIDKFRTCLEKNETQLLDIVVNVVPDAIRLICRNDGEIFFMNNRSFFPCFESMGDYANECLGRISKSTDAMDLSKYGAKQCGEIAEMRECLGTKLNECNAPRMLDVIDLFYRPVMKSTPCKRYIDFEVYESNEITFF
ncbi:27 kDa hemolymph protein-like isoform X2 [Topomyia yanbarensis]|uniref:27 kDa hemolymph protein-like isoform X2 n=1 Tax=Topomyia yanbarensis TaxID=2498891 RepID=UPI00273B5545|nr:27 kDa hemolymph protein-like isoform X2 [Topomyia yanbarensis]